MSSATQHTLFTLVMLGCCALLALGCDDDDHPNPYVFVGSACSDDRDCAQGARCERGGDFPDGTCTFACRDHRDCPYGSACAEVRGGLCLIACGSDAFCRPEYRCRVRDDHNDPGESRVCIK